MIIVDRLLEERAGEGRPVRVGMVGAGFMWQGIANQIVNSTPGIELEQRNDLWESGAAPWKVWR